MTWPGFFAIVCVGLLAGAIHFLFLWLTVGIAW